MPTRQFCDLCDQHIPDDEWYSRTSLDVIPAHANQYPIKDILIDKEHVSPESIGTITMVCQKCTRHILTVILTLKK